MANLKNNNLQQLNIVVPIELYNAMQDIKRESGLTMTWQVLQAVREYIDKHEKK